MKPKKRQNTNIIIVMAFVLSYTAMSCVNNKGRTAGNDHIYDTIQMGKTEIHPVLSDAQMDSIIKQALSAKASEYFLNFEKSYPFEARWIDLIIGLNEELSEYDADTWESIIIYAVRKELSEINNGKDLSDDKIFLLYFDRLVSRLDETCYTDEVLMDYSDPDYNIASHVPEVFAVSSRAVFSSLIVRHADEQLRQQWQEYNAVYDDYLNYLYSSVCDTIVSPDAYRYGALGFGMDCELMRMYDAESLAHSVLGVRHHTPAEEYRDISDNDMKHFYAAVYSHWHNDKEKSKVLRMEESKWFALMQKRASLYKALNAEWRNSFNTATWRMKKTHAVQIRNEFSHYGIMEESRAKALLHNNDSYEKLYSYVFK